MELNQRECSHVGVYMGNYADGNVCKCVLCNSELNNYQIMALASNDLIIYAHNYLKHANPRCMEKFNVIQTMYLGLCRTNKLASNKEIVYIFQEIINRNLREEDKKIESELKTKGIVKMLKKDD